MKIKAILLFLLLILFPAFLFAEELTVEVLDVGQADAILIRTAGKVVLIDAGEQPNDVLNHLKNRNIHDIDLAVATHPHADHIGGMKNVLENFNVKVYFDNGFPHTSTTYNKLMETLENRINQGLTKYAKARQGMRINLGTEAHFDVLLPTDTPFTNTRSDLNSNSVILKLTHGDNCMLFTGDAEEPTELALAQMNLGKCHFYKASHHGSRHSSIPELLDAFKPDIVFISCGLANKHGHPGPEMLERLAQRNIKAYRTDLSGTLTLISDAKSLTVKEEHPPIAITKININEAGIDALRQLPGVGKSTAQKIITYREENGPYTNIEQLLSIPKTQEGRMKKILPFVTITGGSATSLTENTPSPNIDTPPPPPHNITSPNPQHIANNQTNNIITQPTPTKPNNNWTEISKGPNQTDKININTAPIHLLLDLKGMSTSKAQKLIQDRNQNGPFKSCKDVTRVNGIGKKTFEKFEHQCVVQ